MRFFIVRPWALSLLLVQLALSIQLPASYDTVWTTQSINSAGSMPVGGGDVSLNVWVQSGQVLFYIAKDGAFDENNSLLKLGRIRLTLEPNPFAPNATLFEQRLLINDGYATLKGLYNTTIKLWVDVDTSDIHTEITSSIPLELTAAFETWRTKSHVFGAAEQEQTSWGVIAVPQLANQTQYPDQIRFESGGVLNFHHNTDQPLFDAQIVQQGLTNAHPETFYNPMRNNTFGSFMFSPQLKQGDLGSGFYQNTTFTSYNLVAKHPSKEFQLYIATGREQTIQTDVWVKDLLKKASFIPHASQENSLNYWHALWDRSHIIINPDAPSTDPGFQVGKNYQYYRYMLACNGKGVFPTKWNGALFTFDPYYVSEGFGFSADFRRWSGGTFTVQNQRLLHWPLLKSRDYDFIAQELNFYKNFEPTSRTLGKTYFDLDACLVSEQIDNTGLPNIYEYDAEAFTGGNRTALFPPGIDFNSYLAWLNDGANEFVDMAILSNLHGGFDISPWISFIEYQLGWFDEFYRRRNGLEPNGSLIIYPAAADENYLMSTNPSTTVSGLKKVVTDLLIANPHYIKGNTSYYEGYLDRVPVIPYRPCPGATNLTCIAPAVNWSSTHTGEVTTMYPVFPWGEYGLGQPTDLSIAMNTYFNDSSTATYHGDVGWHQDQIWFARMGLTELATANTIFRFADSTEFRFPTFKGPNYDWAPDINHYGSAAIGLQEQLMQTFAKNNTQIRLLAAWPSDWTGYFNLSAPFLTSVSGNITGETVENLVVDPPWRLRDVVYGNKTA